MAQITGKSVLSCWTYDAVSVDLFHNARSAVRYVVLELHPHRLWLPAYLCPEMAQAVSDISIPIIYYPVDGALRPHVSYLGDNLAEGDVVLGINYFGRPAAAGWSNLVSQSKGVRWIEDCAQTIHTDGEHFGDFRIYSPRKFLGAPDGGVLVDTRGLLQRPRLSALSCDRFLKPYEMRASDPQGYDHESWYREFRKVENAINPSSLAMSATSRLILECTDIEPIINCRKRNYSFLLERLPELALFSDVPNSWAPFGFPLLTSRHEELWQHLRQHFVFVPRHWRNLTSPPAKFEREHKLSQALMTIPCDQRYDLEQMERIVLLVREICP